VFVANFISTKINTQIKYIKPEKIWWHSDLSKLILQAQILAVVW